MSTKNGKKYCSKTAFDIHKTASKMTISNSLVTGITKYCGKIDYVQKECKQISYCTATLLVNLN